MSTRDTWLWRRGSISVSATVVAPQEGHPQSGWRGWRGGGGGEGLSPLRSFERGKGASAVYISFQ